MMKRLTTAVRVVCSGRVFLWAILCQFHRPLAILWGWLHMNLMHSRHSWQAKYATYGVLTRDFVLPADVPQGMARLTSQVDQAVEQGPPVRKSTVLPSGYGNARTKAFNQIGACRAKAAAQALRRSFESAGLLRRFTAGRYFDP